jgi:hypothetical protein
MPYRKPKHGQPVGCRCADARFMRRSPGRYEKNKREPEIVTGKRSKCEVTVMKRIENAAQKADRIFRDPETTVGRQDTFSFSL